jgi:hypothetical protein
LEEGSCAAVLRLDGRTFLFSNYTASFEDRSCSTAVRLNEDRSCSTAVRLNEDGSCSAAVKLNGRWCSNHEVSRIIVPATVGLGGRWFLSSCQ